MNKPSALHWGVGAAAFLLYILTLSPGLLPADAGEFQLNGAVLGISHPPGFALYTLLSWLASRLPWLTPALAINLLSALLAALTLALVSRGVARLTGSPLAGVAAALALGFGVTFWAQAVTANIRVPAALATAWALERLTAYRAEPTAGRPGAGLAWVALALGLGVAHHASLVFVAALMALFALWLRPAVLRQPRALALAAAAGLAPFAAWLYLPLRGAALGQTRLATWDGFWEHVLARGFSGDIFFFASWSALPDRLGIFANILSFQFAWPLLALMGLGLAAALWRDRPMGALLLAAVGLHCFVAITYRAPQTVEYLLPAYVLMAVWAGYGAAALAAAAARLPLGNTRRAAAAAGLITAVALGAQLRATLPSYLALTRDTSTRQAAASLLAQAPDGAVILSAWHWATPLWYLQQVEGWRPDVQVVYVFPQGESLAANWAEEIARRLPERPVVVTNYYAVEYGGLPYRFAPLGPGWEVRAEAMRAAPPGLQGEQAFGAWTFLGHALQSDDGWPLKVLAGWRSEAAPQDVSFFVHLLGPDGQLHSQHDVAYPASRYAAGEVLLDRYNLALRPDAAPGVYTLLAGAYLPDGTRLAETALATVQVTQPPAMLAQGPEGAVPTGLPTAASACAMALGSDMWLAGSRVEPGGALRPGDTLTVRLDFLAARPITSDYVMGVSLTGDGWRWRVQSDSIPAGGAIPTLKWIAGSRVRDTHRLTVPPDAAPGPAELRLSVYDFFTQEVLGILNPELAAQGPGLLLATLEIGPP